MKTTVQGNILYALVYLDCLLLVGEISSFLNCLFEYFSHIFEIVVAETDVDYMFF